MPNIGNNNHNCAGIVDNYPRLITFPAKTLVHDLDEALRRGRQKFAFTGNDAVAALGEILIDRDDVHPAAVLFGDTDIGDDRYALSEADIALDYFPASGLERDPEIDVVLGKHHFNDMPGAEMARR